MMTILKEIDQEFLYQTINREQFKKYFFENAEDGEIKEYIANQLKHDKESDQLSFFDPQDPFMGNK